MSAIAGVAGDGDDGGGGSPALKGGASVASTSSPRRFSISPRRFSISPRRASSKLGGLLQRAGPKTPPAHKAPFSVPSVAWQQAGGFYSDAELPGGNVEGCPNWKNPAHHCTTYCFERFAPLSRQERFLGATSAAIAQTDSISSNKGDIDKSSACCVS